MTVETEKGSGEGLSPIRVGHVRWTIILTLFGLITFDYIDRGLVSSALPVLTTLYHLNGVEQAVIGDGFTYGYLIMNPVVGILMDRKGLRLLMASSGFAWGSVQVITAGAFDFLYLAIARVFLGIAEAVGFPGVVKITSNWMTTREKARGGTISDSGVNVGIVLGSLVLLGFDLIIPSDVAWRYAFIFSGLLTIVFVFVLIYNLYDTPETHPRISKAELEYIRKNQDPVVDQSKVNVYQWFGTMDYWGFQQGLGAQAGIFYGLLAFLPLYLSVARHFTLTLTLGYTALIWGMGFVGENIGGFVVDYLIRKIGPNRAMKIGFSVSSLGVTLGLAATVFSTSPITAVEILMITFFCLRWSGIQWSAASFIVPKKLAGQWGGHIGFWETLWGIVIPLVFGVTILVTKAYTEGMIIMIFVGVVYFLGSVVFTRYRPLKFRGEGAP